MGWAALAALLPPERLARARALEAKSVGHGFTFADAKMRSLLQLTDPEGAAWTLCRPALRSLLAEDMPIVWNKRFAALAEEQDHVKVSFTDGSEVRADFVVACDGVGSDVRKAIPGAPPVAETGISIVAGTVPRTRAWDAALPLNQAGAVQYLGSRGQTLFVSFCERDDRSPMVLWALSCHGAISGTLGEEFHPTLRRMIEETRSEDVYEQISLRSSRVKVPKAALWASGRVTLLGDAAHAMPPQRGMGGNNALEDARLLCTLIEQPDRCARFEREMFTRAKLAIEESEEAAGLCHMRSPVLSWLRNLVLRGLSLRSRRAPVLALSA
jgi:2-polyprenyl-6-methoxyphenol hydroxylase-like FAD-dependent oxidoreductase